MDGADGDGSGYVWEDRLCMGGIRWRGSLAIDIELETVVDGGRVKWADGKSERKKTNRKQVIRRRRQRRR